MAASITIYFLCTARSLQPLVLDVYNVLDCGLYNLNFGIFDYWRGVGMRDCEGSSRIGAHGPRLVLLNVEGIVWEYESESVDGILEPVSALLLPRLARC